jgi:hypothetical protein
MWNLQLRKADPFAFFTAPAANRFVRRGRDAEPRLHPQRGRIATGRNLLPIHALRTSTTAALLVVSVAAGLAGCGGGEKKSAARPTVTTLPDCAPDATRVALPDSFPKDFPLPGGALVQKARDDGKTMNVEALVPGEIRDVAGVLIDRLPQVGFELGEGDSEEHEAESHFTGKGFAGFFKLNTVGGCDGANTLALVLTRA